MSETTQNAPSEVLFQPEAELLAVASIADIDHFRVITKDGKSLKATPAQVREMVGVSNLSVFPEILIKGDPAIGGSRPSYNLWDGMGKLYVKERGSAKYLVAIWVRNYNNTQVFYTVVAAYGLSLDAYNIGGTVVVGGLTDGATADWVLTWILK